MPRHFLQVHDRCRQIGLDGDVGQATSGSTAQAVLRFGAAVCAFDEPTVATIDCLRFVFPSARALATRSKQRGVSIQYKDAAYLGGCRNAAFAHRSSCTVGLADTVDVSVIFRRARHRRHSFARRAFHEQVFLVALCSTLHRARSSPALC